MQQKIRATWIIHSEDSLVLLHPALTRFLYPHEPITEDLNSFLRNSYNVYPEAKKDISNFINTKVLEIIQNPTDEVILQSKIKYKKIVDIYIKIRKVKFKSLGFIIYNH